MIRVLVSGVLAGALLALVPISPTPAGAVPLRISTVAGRGLTTGDQATTGSLSRPWGIVLDGAGNTFVVDSGKARVLRVSPAGLVTVVAGTGSHGYSGDSGPAIAAQLAAPRGL